MICLLLNISYCYHLIINEAFAVLSVNWENIYISLRTSILKGPCLGATMCGLLKKTPNLTYNPHVFWMGAWQIIPYLFTFFSLYIACFSYSLSIRGYELEGSCMWWLWDSTTQQYQSPKWWAPHLPKTVPRGPHNPTLKRLKCETSTPIMLTWYLVLMSYNYF